MTVQYPLLAFLLISAMCTTGACEDIRLNVRVVDRDTQKPLASRLYLRSADGKWYFFDAESPGQAVRYEKQNWIDKSSVEYHTTTSAHPCFAKIPRGATYSLLVERGKSYLPYEVEIATPVGKDGSVEDGSVADASVKVELQRWNNPAERGWYSGDTHLHREIDELRTVIDAEDLNVAMPLTNWVTASDKAPSAGDKNLADIPDGLVAVDSEHVIWPLNTEYEIFSVGPKRHTLGALFVLGHKQPLELGVPPWKPVVESAKAADPNVLFDMDKLDWPFAMLLPTICPDATYELANNHVWRTKFAFKKWNTFAPSYMRPPFGANQGGHREWLDYTHGMYYTLLNCGFRLPPSAGTANGVHPVPAGFGRVYVHLPDGFSLEGWMKGLKAGRSFVTTGPMLYATADEKDPGHVFRFQQQSRLPIKLELRSEKRLSYGELLVNGFLKPYYEQRTKSWKTAPFFRTWRTEVQIKRSGWFALRFWEPREDGQSRFVHSAPWYVEVDGQPVRPRAEEKRYLMERVEAEMKRSRGIVSEPAMQEYERAYSFYKVLPVFDDSAERESVARPLENRQEGLVGQYDRAPSIHDRRSAEGDWPFDGKCSAGNRT